MPTVPLSRAYISLISLMMIRDAASMKAEVISDARCGYVYKFSQHSTHELSPHITAGTQTRRLFMAPMLPLPP